MVLLHRTLESYGPILGDNSKDKQLVAVPYKGGFTIVQKRRIEQFVPYAGLDPNEQQKETPLKTMKALLQSDAQRIQELIDYIRGPRVSYVVTLPEGRIVQATQLPDLVSSGDVGDMKRRATRDPNSRALLAVTRHHCHRTSACGRVVVCKARCARPWRV